MAFDQVGIVTVHRPDEITHGIAQDRMDPTCKLVGLGNQRHDLVFEVVLGLLGDHGLHRRNVHRRSIPDIVPV